MRNLFACAVMASAIALAGCSSLPTLNLANTVNLNTLEGVVSGYGILANQEVLIMAQPLCKTGTAPSLSNICVKRSQKVALQTFDANANRAVNAAVAFVKNNPSVDPSSYISAASQALSALQSVLNAAKPTGS
jgi:hypothetical protein